LTIQKKSDGEEARVVYKMAELYRMMKLPPESTKVVDLEKRARLLKDRTEKDFGDLIHDPSVKLDEQQQYDRLVCWLHR
jgi:hypothetical protein